MRIGVLSDSHDNLPRIQQAVELFTKVAPDLVVHAGDFVAPFAVEPLRALPCRVLAVFGNNDGEQLGLARRLAEVGEVHPYLATTTFRDRRLAVVHYPELAEPLAASGDFDLVVYGHTHEVDERRVGKTLLLNPGEVGGWLTGRSTVALVDLESRAVDLRELG